MKAVFLDTDTLRQGISFEVLEKLPLQLSFFKQTKAQETAERIKDAQVAIANKVHFSKEILQSSPQLKLICIAATGYNNVDIEAAKSLNIKVCNVPEYSTVSVVQFTLSLILALATNIIPYAEATKMGKWQKSTQFCLLDYPLIDLQGKKLGIIGYGFIGKQVANIARAFGMEILVAQRSSSNTSIEGAIALEDLLRTSDFVSIHAPLTAQTKNMIGSKELNLLKKTAFLINTARGGIVNEKDLAECLKAHRIAGAGFDVLSIEPPSEDNPLLQKDVPNLILTPHVAWASIESRIRLVNTIRDNIQAYLQGEAKNLIG